MISPRLELAEHVARLLSCYTFHSDTTTMGFNGTQNYGEAKPSASELGQEKRVEADMQTHELLFVNDYALKIFGNDIVGQQR